MTIYVHIDWETLSAADLTVVGHHEYADHPTTDAHCLAIRVGNGPVELLTRSDFYRQDIYDWIKSLIDHPDVIFVAHQAGFEDQIWNKVMTRRYGWPRLPLHKLHCTMAMSYGMALPGSLENAAASLGMTNRKNMKSRQVMLRLAQPKEVAVCGRCDGAAVALVNYMDGDQMQWKRRVCPLCEGLGKVYTFHTPEESPQDFQTLYEYCIQDVVVESELHDRLVNLPPIEWETWWADQEINERGVQVDLVAARAMDQILMLEKARLDEAMYKITEGSVKSYTELPKLKKWLGRQGFEAKKLNKDVLPEVLEKLEREEFAELAPRAKAALKVLAEGNKSSNSKTTPVLESSGADGRMRGILQYGGAKRTMRWAGRRVQPHNLPKRKKLSLQDYEHVFEILHSGLPPSAMREMIEVYHGSVPSVISESLRGLFIARPGTELHIVDYAAIEARVVAWLAGATKILEAFSTHGKVYEQAAAGIFRVPMEQITKGDFRRDAGKVCSLFCGYQGKVGAWRKAELQYDVRKIDEETGELRKFTDAEIKPIVDAWREANPEIPKYWKDLNRAAINAVLSPKRTFEAGHPDRPTRFRKSGSFLWVQVPGGIPACYPYPRVEKTTVEIEGEEPFEVDSVTYLHAEGKGRDSSYGGKWAENCTQRVARNILRDALLRLRAAGKPVVLHVHDEPICELPAGSDLHETERLVAVVPDWAKGLPIAVEGFVATRYRK